MSFFAEGASRPRFTTQRPFSMAAPCTSDTLNVAFSRASISPSLQAESRAPVSVTCNRRESGESMETDVSESPFRGKECAQPGLKRASKL
jgi:hypothetical protein